MLIILLLASANSASGQFFKFYSQGSLIDNTGDNSIIKVRDGGVIFVGHTGTGTSAQVFVLKVNSLGSIQWAYEYGDTTKYDIGTAIKERLNGQTHKGYAICGVTKSAGRQHDVLIMLIDSVGTLQWAKSYGTHNKDELGYSIDLTINNDPDWVCPPGGIVVGGRVILGGATYPEFYVVKTNCLGFQGWARRYDVRGYIYENGKSIKTLADSTYVLIGNVQDSSGFLPLNAAVLKLNNVGLLTWSKIYDDSLYFMTGNSIIETVDPGYIFTGINNNNPPLMAASAAHLVKIDNIGNVTWANSYASRAIENYEYFVTEMPGKKYGVGGISSDDYLTVSDIDMWVFETDSAGIPAWAYLYRGFSDTSEHWLHSFDKADSNTYVFAGRYKNKSGAKVLSMVYTHPGSRLFCDDSVQIHYEYLNVRVDSPVTTVVSHGTDTPLVFIRTTITPGNFLCDTFKKTGSLPPAEVEMNNEEDQLGVYPTLLLFESKLNVVYNSELGGELKIQVLNQLGDVILDQQHFCTTGVNKFILDIPDAGSGLFIISATQKGKKPINRKVIILK